MNNVRVVVALLLVMSVALAGVSAMFYLRAGESRAQAEILRAEGEAAKVIGAKSAASAEIARLKKRVGELEKELELAQAGGGAAPAPAEPESGAKDAKSGKGMMKTLAKMMGDPAMKDAIRQQQRVAMKGIYADLFAELGLSEEEEGAMMNLMLDKQMMQTELGMEMMNGSLSEAERKELASKIKDETERVDGEIEEALGKEKFASYELFVDSQPERMQLSAFKESLAGAGEPLSIEAEEKLMNAMYETRKGFKFAKDFGTDAKPNPEAWAGFDKAAADRLIADMKQLQGEVAAKAGAVLTPAQLEAFRAVQEGQLKMQEMGIKMGLQMQE